MRIVLKRSPEEMARREEIDEILKAANVTSVEDIQELFKETLGSWSMGFSANWMTNSVMTATINLRRQRTTAGMAIAAKT